MRRFALLLGFALAGAHALAQEPAQRGFQPQVGQAGKDVVWVPMPEEQLEKMLEEIRFGAGGVEYRGRINGNVIAGTVSADGAARAWRVTRSP
jgi:hypothetical protein